ncbi:hypothetical protein CPB83DRAFT_892921 [Crepidotus variabilis]|uniref:Uncharacterized protein n=1 Tax=Crepidotus variabilis TaxID=179855 RepID=A0A9P6EHY0_9AGAR|nr:hypothetical protein CPB83DRAFT_892921 [Crepidotus variabilis]
MSSSINCFADREALHKLKMHLAMARLRSALRATLITGKTNPCFFTVPLHAELDICLGLLGVAYATGYQLTVPPLLSFLAQERFWHGEARAGFFQDLESLLHTDFSMIRDESIIHEGGDYELWWKQLPGFPEHCRPDSFLLEQQFCHYIKELRQQGYDLPSPPASVGKSVQHPVIYPNWQLTARGLSSRFKNREETFSMLAAAAANVAQAAASANSLPTTSASTDAKSAASDISILPSPGPQVCPDEEPLPSPAPDCPSRFLESSLRIVNSLRVLLHLTMISLDETHVFTQAAMVRSVESADRSHHAVACIADLRAMHQRDAPGFQHGDESLSLTHSSSLPHSPHLLSSEIPNAMPPGFPLTSSMLSQKEPSSPTELTRSMDSDDEDPGSEPSNSTEYLHDDEYNEVPDESDVTNSNSDDEFSNDTSE